MRIQKNMTPNSVLTCKGPCTSCVVSAGETRAIRVSSAARFEARLEGNLNVRVRGREIDRGPTVTDARTKGCMEGRHMVGQTRAMRDVNITFHKECPSPTGWEYIL